MRTHHVLRQCALIVSLLHAAGCGDGRPAVTTPAAVPTDEQGLSTDGFLHRLSIQQYKNTLHDLLGNDIVISSDLEPETSEQGFVAVGGSMLTLSFHAVEQREAVALSAAEQAMASPTHRAALVDCEPTGTVDAACTARFVSSFGRRAWRRTLSAEEIARYVGLATTNATTQQSFWEGLACAAAGILQSPHFLFRVELGDGPPEQALRAYTSVEMASRLSYFLWNSTPDAALLDAAERGELATPSGIQTHATRLLSAPRARAALSNFFGELLGLSRLDNLSKDVSVFPSMTATLGPAMREDLTRTTMDLLFDRAGDYRDLFTASSTFVNAELATFYGLPTPNRPGFVGTLFPAGQTRAGLLGHAGIAAMYGHATSSSPTRRGKFIREVLLCAPIPPPPDDVITALPPMDTTTPHTLRQRIEAHSSDARCAACHTLMDPIGVGLESFDGIGQFRTVDNGLPIDPSGALDGSRFADARQLGQLLHDHEQLSPCFVRNFYRYATGHLETAAEEPALTALTTLFVEGGYQLRPLVLGIVQSDGFRFAFNSPP